MKQEQHQPTSFPIELPTLRFDRTRLISDYEVEKVSFSATGFSMSEAKEGMTYLLEVSKGVSK